MYKHILVALDTSPRAARVLRQAAAIAAGTGATLHLCHAVHVPAGLPADAWKLTIDELIAHLLSEADRTLAAQLTAVGLDPSVAPGRRISRLGAPFQVIVDVAGEVAADLIVIGSHGFGMLDRLLGSTADRVVHRAPCSVLVVRDEVREAPAA